MGKISRFRSSCARAKYHRSLCFLFIHSVVSNGFVRGQGRHRSNCTDAGPSLSAYAQRQVFTLCSPFNFENWIYMYVVSANQYFWTRRPCFFIFSMVKFSHLIENNCIILQNNVKILKCNIHFLTLVCFM